MWLSKIRKNKLQTFFVFIIICVTSCILSTCLFLTSNVNSYVEEYYEKYFDEFCFISDANDQDALIDYFAKNKINYATTFGYKVNLNVYLNGKNMDLKQGYITVIENKTDSRPWNISIVEEKKDANKEKPGKNEVWVPKIVADANNISIGDKIEIKNAGKSISYEVTALVNDQLEPTTIIGNNNFFVGNSVSNIMDNNDKIYLTGYDYSDGVSVSKDFTKKLGHNYNGTMISAKAYSNVAKLTTVTVGGIGLVASILIFIAAIIVIRYILWNSIIREYKNIGIYKALGFSNQKIANIYILSYGVPCLVGIITGSCISLFVSNQFVENIVKYIGSYELTSKNISEVVISSIVLFIVYIVSLYMLLRKIREINPVEALTMNIKKSQKQFSSPLIKNCPKASAWALNDIVKYKPQNLLIGTIFVLVSFLTIFFYNVNYSISNMASYTDRWFGNYVGDYVLNTYDSNDSFKDIIKYLDTQNIKYRYGSYSGSGLITIDTEKYGINNTNLKYSIYNTYDKTGGFRCEVTEGRNPNKNNEIALSENIMKDGRFSIGDKIEIKVGNETKKMSIVGSYASLYNNSYTFRTLLSVLPSRLQNSMNMDIIVKLPNSYNSKKFTNEIENRFKGTKVEVIPSDIKNGLSDLKIVSTIICIIISAILVFCMLNIINVIIMTKTDNRKNFGIMKAIGFSNSQIILRILLRIELLSLAASFIGYVLYLLWGASIFQTTVMGIDGIVKNVRNDLIVMGLFNMFILITSLFSMLSIRSISTIELMEE